MKKKWRERFWYDTHPYSIIFKDGERRVFKTRTFREEEAITQFCQFLCEKHQQTMDKLFKREKDAR